MSEYDPTKAIQGPWGAAGDVLLTLLPIMFLLVVTRWFLFGETELSPF
jgi:hypothetical protein